MTSTREPFSYMSWVNYRGFRSPWSAILIGAALVAVGVWTLIAATGNGFVGDGLIGLAFGLVAGGILLYIGISRLVWLRRNQMMNGMRLNQAYWDHVRGLGKGNVFTNRPSNDQ